MTTPRDVADRIKSAYKAKKRSQKWLSDESGVPEKTLRRRFLIPGPFTLEELCAIATALELSLEELIAEKVSA